MEFYDQWLKNGHHGEMTYLERHRNLKAAPETWLPFAKSALVFAIPYLPLAAENIKSDYVTGKTLAARTALYVDYARDQTDYHATISEELNPVLLELRERYPGAKFQLALDAQPVLERDLAVRAGLGWIGKNTCVLDRLGGSLFFIAEILTSLETDEAALEVQDFCGTCTRCLDACPTKALVAPRVLDATKCISYWTIESKKIPPKDLRSKFGDWFFGCDICQTVCPWNIKVHGANRMMPLPSDREQLVSDLRFILQGSNREIERRFENTPMVRARPFGLKRNALIVAGNLKLNELAANIEALFNSERLGQLAKEIHAELVVV